MRQVLRDIDKALRDLYQLDSHHRPEDFLARIEGDTGEMRGALLVRDSGDEASVGIYLSDEVRRRLDYFPFWPAEWNLEQLSAFSVAVEEVSHFHYFVFHASKGRPVSQLELEIQGDIDKFLLAHFATSEGVETLMERLFEHFSLEDNLTVEQKDRYETANKLARRFVVKCRSLIKENREELFRFLRRYYRLNASEKMGVIAAA